MNRILKPFIAKILWLLSKLYSLRMSKMVNGCKSSLYSLWIRNFLGGMPLNSIIAYPCRLEGGGHKNIFIGNHTGIQSHSVIGCWGKYGKEQIFHPMIVIGNHCSIGEYNHLSACNKIIIGNGLLTGRFVYIGDNSHGGLSLDEAEIPPIQRKLVTKGEIRIGNNVWIGDKVTILGGVTIGNNVILAANSVVTHDLPSNCLAAGVPATIIKKIE